MIDLENLFGFTVNNYGLFIEGYLLDMYLPWRTLILAVLVIAGRKAWRKWRNK